jgi:hypothetical protein
VSPPLPRDPTPWSTGTSGTFALEAIESNVQRTGHQEYCSFFLVFEDTEETRAVPLAQIYVSIMAGAVAGTCGSVLLYNVDPAVWGRILAFVIAVVGCAAALLLLLPRRHSIKAN